MKAENELEAIVEDLKNRMKVMEASHVEFKKALEDNTAVTKAIKTDTEDIVSIFKGAKTTVNVLVILGSAAKKIATIALAFGTLWTMWYAWSHGLPPPDIKH